MQNDENPTRRHTLKLLAGLGAGGVLGRAAAAAGGPAPVTAENIAQAEWLSGIPLDGAKRELLVAGMNDLAKDLEKLRQVPLDNAVPPALRFEPLAPAATWAQPGGTGAGQVKRAGTEPLPLSAARRPAADDDLAFAPVSVLAALLRSRQVSSVELTRLYLNRLCRFDPRLRCVITFTEELAMRQAREADREIGAGRWRGPLHGVPWGAKDLLAVPGYPTTWGAGPFAAQVRPETATVYARLAEAGAVLVAKLAVGELAWGDVWYGGTTRNPWRLDQGASGSSAGSASATAAGLVGFALGTETWGSIVSPCTRCGASGLRPTFGRVSRHGAMALAWSMDKIGPIARSVPDLAQVFAAIHGADGLDPSATDRPFAWPGEGDPRRLRLGYVEALFAEERGGDVEDGVARARLAEWRSIDQETLDVLRRLGFELIPIRLPDSIPVAALSLILVAEAAAAFDDLTRSGRDALLVRQIADAWPTVFRQGQLIPAVEYLRANRLRTRLMSELEQAISGVDACVVPSFGGDQLLLTNLTGHPAVVVPNGFTRDGAPTSITFFGRLHGDDRLLAVAQTFQAATDHHLRRPEL